MCVCICIYIYIYNYIHWHWCLKSDMLNPGWELASRRTAQLIYSKCCSVDLFWCSSAFELHFMHGTCRWLRHNLKMGGQCLLTSAVSSCSILCYPFLSVSLPLPSLFLSIYLSLFVSVFFFFSFSFSFSFSFLSPFPSPFPFSFPLFSSLSLSLFLSPSLFYS